MEAIAWSIHDGQGLTTRRAINGAAICVAFAGLVHLLSAPQHLEHVGHALFLILAGVTEVSWGLAFWRKPSAALYSLGVVLAGAFIVLWAITRVVAAPFGHGPGDVEVAGIISKLAEGVGLGGLLAMILLGARSGDIRRPVWKMILTPLTLAVAGAFVLYGAGLTVEQMAPWLGGHDQADVEHHEHSAVQDAALSLSPSTGARAGALLPEKQGKYDTLTVSENGASRALENGGSVTLADGVVAEVFLTPFPAGRRTNLYFYLIQDGGDLTMGNPKVEAEYSMTQMGHGTYKQAGLKLQDGRYLLPLNFLMSGEWAIDLRLGWTDRTSHLRLVTTVAP